MLLLTLKVLNSLRSERLAQRFSHEYGVASVKFHQTCYTCTKHSDLQVSDLLGMEGHYHCNKIFEPKIHFKCYVATFIDCNTSACIYWRLQFRKNTDFSCVYFKRMEMAKCTCSINIQSEIQTFCWFETTSVNPRKEMLSVDRHPRSQPERKIVCLKELWYIKKRQKTKDNERKESVTIYFSFLYRCSNVWKRCSEFVNQ